MLSPYDIISASGLFGLATAAATDPGPGVADIVTGLSGAGAFAIALFAVARALSNDSTKRMTRHTERVENRLDHTERVLARERNRRYQAEALLQEKGIRLPSWTMIPEDSDEFGGDSTPE